MGKITEGPFSHSHRENDHNGAASTDLPDYTAAPLASHQLSTQICCISLNSTDKIRLINVPFDLTDLIRATILSSWGNPVQKEDRIASAHEFKLKGNPWIGAGEESVRSRRLVCQVMKGMAERGWNLIQAADISKQEHDQDSLFFENMTGSRGIVDINVEMFAMSFNKMDTIRLIDAPPQFISLVKDAIIKSWPKGLQKEGDYAGSYEFKLRGNPFYASKEQAIYCRMLLCHVLGVLRNQGFKLYSSVDVSRGQEGMDLESWIFRRVGPAWS
ncbi:hypothetical protein BGZ83_008766 [Gryganskiella cystojenkinii]|nr:hypothetical protein BGZ83_008766 [Gryganskiella cystojenkinii]